ncbi:hypothetical protein D9613_009799 [Agrocybe pediades]|uniref:N-acetyltransferase domain-containing protein n=1 Tax=Agrocybe pediades TaxID=84607 RepID=A0A8H4QXV1_9AGAR|nr:hypothetical protein D9613_009799 [Agrocybe pediades]
MESSNIDFNFCFPVPNVLGSERVQLVPFVPSEHAEPFIEQCLLYPSVFENLPFGPFKDAHDLTTNYFIPHVQSNPGYLMFLIWDKTKPSSLPGAPGSIAGMMGYLNTSSINLSTEIGCIIIFPPFQRTHVTSNAVGLLLNYALNLPSRQAGALGLRRVFWQTNSMNQASVRLAGRMQFKLEGTLRWDRVLPANKTVGNGKKVREGDPRSDCIGRDTVMLSLCWDDWEDGAREAVDAIMNRTA